MAAMYLINVCVEIKNFLQRHPSCLFMQKYKITPVEAENRLKGHRPQVHLKDKDTQALTKFTSDLQNGS